MDNTKTKMKLKYLLIVSLAILLISCVDRSNHRKNSSTQLSDSTTAIKDQQPLQNQTSSKNVQIEILSEQIINQYFEKIYTQEKLINENDYLMLTVPDSLFSNNPQKQLYYFIVFTKSMNGSDGFYSESDLNLFFFKIK